MVAKKTTRKKAVPRGMGPPRASQKKVDKRQSPQLPRTKSGPELGVGGRPSKFSTAIADMICDNLADGQSLRQMCRDNDDLPKARTVRRWMLGIGIPESELEEFRHNYGVARTLYEQHVFDKLHDVGRDVATNKDHIALAKLWSDNVRWGLKVRNRAEYGDRADIGLGGSEGALPIPVIKADISQLTSKEQEQMRKLARKTMLKKSDK